MANTTEKSWTWKQPGGSELKVVSNAEKGTIRVYNDRGVCVLDKKDLTPEQLKIIEQQFLNVVTKKPVFKPKENVAGFDPMVA